MFFATLFVFTLLFPQYFANADVLVSRASNVQAVCRLLQPQEKVFYASSAPYNSTLYRFAMNTAQKPACVFRPTTPEEISQAIKLIGANRTPFAVSGGRHATNKGFSSTTGLQIDLSELKKVKLSKDRSYVDVSAGCLWDDVYRDLDGTGVSVNGGRVQGVGVSGFIGGGGGYSWTTNQVGLAGDLLLKADLVLADGTITSASESQLSDLFWGLKGASNRLAIVYNWRLKTFPQLPTVFGGPRVYQGDEVPKALKAIQAFNTENVDPLAEIIPTINMYGGGVSILLLAFYDGPNGKVLSKYFGGLNASYDDWKERSFYDLVMSSDRFLAQAAGTRGLFHTIPLREYSEPILRQLANQSQFYGSQANRSGKFMSFDVEYFLKGWSVHAKKGALYPHDGDKEFAPLHLYFAWTDEKDDEYFAKAAKSAERVITELAIAEGQDLTGRVYYPNYALATTPASKLYGEKNLIRLRKIRRKYDPNNVFLALTEWFNLAE